MKHRLERVNEVIKRELSEIISRELNFSAQVLVTIHAVDITADFRKCHVFISVIGKPSQKTRVLADLEEHLSFKLDDSIERGSRVLEIMQDLEKPRED
jgi:ribosome-binding factor A